MGWIMKPYMEILPGIGEVKPHVICGRDLYRRDHLSEIIEHR